MNYLKHIIGLIILEKDGRRVLGKYNENCNIQDETEKKTFEKELSEFLKSSFHYQKKETGLFIFKEKLVLARNFSDMFLVLVSEQNENEIFLKNLIEAVDNSIIYFCGKDMNLNQIFRFYTEILLIFDEATNEGLVVTLSSEELISKVLLKENRQNKRSGFFS